ncbi:hypothetical protein D3C80_1166060 [compost metagenome]
MHVVDAIERERQGLAHMADHHLQLREPVEHARGDHAQDMHARLHAEPIDGSVQTLVQQGLDHGVVRAVRVQIDGRVQSLGRLEDRPELLIIQIFALGVGIDDHPVQAQLRDAPLDLFRRGFGILGRTGGQPGVARGMAPDRVRQPVVGVGGKTHGLVPGHRLDARRGQGQDSHVHPRRVHMRQTAVVHIRQTVPDMAAAGAVGAEIEAPHAVEPDVVDGPGLDQQAIPLQHLRRTEGFLGRDAPIGNRRGLKRHRGTSGRCVSSGIDWAGTAPGRGEDKAPPRQNRRQAGRQLAPAPPRVGN